MSWHYILKFTKFAKNDQAFRRWNFTFLNLKFDYLNHYTFGAVSLGVSADGKLHTQIRNV